MISQLITQLPEIAVEAFIEILSKIGLALWAFLVDLRFDYLM